jgi:hypothetical protein
MRRRRGLLEPLHPPEKLVIFDDDEWLTDADPQPDGTERRWEERTGLARRRWVDARREWSEQMKTAGCSLPQINAALYPPRFNPRDPDPRLP